MLHLSSQLANPSRIRAAFRAKEYAGSKFATIFGLNCCLALVCCPSVSVLFGPVRGAVCLLVATSCLCSCFCCRCRGRGLVSQGGSGQEISVSLFSEQPRASREHSIWLLQNDHNQISLLFAAACICSLTLSLVQLCYLGQDQVLLMGITTMILCAASELWEWETCAFRHFFLTDVLPVCLPDSAACLA